MMADKEIWVATAHSRKTKLWRNEKMTWGELRAKCLTERHTSETLAEFKAMPKEQQSDIKDVGGFVGGYVKDGKRSKGQITFRSVLTLDIDYGVSDVWDEFTLAFSCEALCYSTHNHTPEKPRLRLVLLLSRNVSPEEYEAVGRAVAVRVGISYFDDTTYEPERLMYWPSTPSDQRFYCDSQTGEPLNVDDILNSYVDWRDTSSWSYSRRAVERIDREKQKQGDPLSKKGFVGAFCRCFDIRQAIEEFIPEVYEPCGEGRYSYKQGTVAAGLVLYENGLFAYSHNNTDPCSQSLVNAFDLVRMHKFGLLDEDTDPHAPVTRRPSYESMCEMCKTLPAVRRAIIEERQASAVNDFNHLPQADTDEEDDTSWYSLLDVDKNGNPKNTMRNAETIITEHPKLKGRLWHNELTGYDCFDGKLPWPHTGNAGELNNRDYAALRGFLSSYGIKGKDMIDDALSNVVTRVKRHPVREYLRSLTWDGTPRLETLFMDFLGAADTELAREQTKIQFKAAVARVFAPGCKYDQFLILAGKQGVGKSLLLERMGGKWFMGSLQGFEGKDAMASLKGSWIIESAELVSVKRGSAEEAKSFISRREDEYRPAYGRVTERHPRQCVFFGTTNESHFLKGNDGNRRYWVVEVAAQAQRMRVWDDLTPDYRDQLWAEAVHLYDEDAGDEYHKNLVLPEHLLAQAEENQLRHNEITADERVGLIQTYLDTRLPRDWDSWSVDRRRAFFRVQDPLGEDGIILRRYVCAIEIYAECLGMPIDDKTRYRTADIHAILRDGLIPGWKYKGTMRTRAYGPQRCYERMDWDEAEEEAGL